MLFLTEEQVGKVLKDFFEEISKQEKSAGKVCFVVGQVPEWDEEEDEEFDDEEEVNAIDEDKEWVKERQKRDALRTPEALARIERAWLPLRSKEVLRSMTADFQREVGDKLFMQTTSTSYMVFDKFRRQIDKVCASDESLYYFTLAESAHVLHVQSCCTIVVNCTMNWTKM